MTYKDQFVAEIKVNGKILRLRDDTAYLPFGCEYTLYLKNLNSRRASVKVSIDGEDVLDGQSLVIDANSSTELQGFLKGNVARNSFRFIQKTKDIQDHRGDKIDDGMIRIEFAYEKEIDPIIKKTIIHEHHYYKYDNPFHWNYRGFYHDDNSQPITYGNSSSAVPQSINTNTVRSCFNHNVESNVVMDSLDNTPNDDEGITVKGSEIHQGFHTTYLGELEPSQVIVIRLKGKTDSKPIQQPLTVQSKLKCPTCGKHCKSSFKFCPNCATFLE
jgi:hypothetical protein